MTSKQIEMLGAAKIQFFYSSKLIVLHAKVTPFFDIFAVGRGCVFFSGSFVWQSNVLSPVFNLQAGHLFHVNTSWLIQPVFLFK